jgi:hypothetical protein
MMISDHHPRSNNMPQNGIHITSSLICHRSGPPTTGETLGSTRHDLEPTICTRIRDAEGAVIGNRGRVIGRLPSSFGSGHPGA